MGPCWVSQKQPLWVMVPAATNRASRRWRGETIMKDSSNCLERRSSGEGPAGCIDPAGAGLADFSDRGKKTGRAGGAGQGGEGA